jgi:hypothetical protein
LWSIQYLNVRLDQQDHHQHVDLGMPALLVSIAQVRLQDIGVKNLCLARQAQFSESCTTQAIYQYNLATYHWSHFSP